jgi:DNA-binding PadR family transcriptional regulator/ADP-ribose pyrophosphatase YjhB (NUDIX family)
VSRANLTRIVILWLLSESRLHGYEIKRILSDPGLQFWFPIEFASIYSVLRFLTRSGYAREVAVERAGKRPERTRYAITPAGRAYLQQLLREAWARPGDVAAPVDAALAAEGELDEAEIPALVERRRAALRERLDLLRRIGRGAPSPAMVRRAELVTEAELAWLKELGRPSHAMEVTSVEATSMKSRLQPAIQLIANLVVIRADGQVLFVRYDPEDERWWLPGEDLNPYEHPDEAAQRVLGAFTGLTVSAMTMREIESFRGRRGWHVMFHYRVEAEGDVTSRFPTAWFPLSSLPRTVHGRWETDIARKIAQPPLPPA